MSAGQQHPHSAVTIVEAMGFRVSYNGANATPVRDWDWLVWSEDDPEAGTFGEGRTPERAALDAMYSCLLCDERH